MYLQCWAGGRGSIQGRDLQRDEAQAEELLRA